jgi:hypothetical protein
MQGHDLQRQRAGNRLGSLILDEQMFRRRVRRNHPVAPGTDGREERSTTPTKPLTLRSRRGPKSVGQPPTLRSRSTGGGSLRDCALRRPLNRRTVRRRGSCWLTRLWSDGSCNEMVSCRLWVISGHTRDARTESAIHPDADVEKFRIDVCLGPEADKDIHHLVQNFILTPP